jgi:hypothetical protein
MEGDGNDQVGASRQVSPVPIPEHADGPPPARGGSLRSLWVGAVLALLGTSCSAPAEAPGAEDRSAPSIPVTTSPLSEKEVTLGLHLFVDGRIIAVSEGRGVTVARWPSSTAPYQAPVETPRGYVGLAQGKRRLELWSVTDVSARRLANGVSQRFAVSPDGRRVAFGQTDLTTARSPTTLVVMGTRRSTGSPVGTGIFDGYAAPVGFIGRKVLIGTGDGAASAAGLWDQASGAIRTFHGYGRAGATDPVGRRGILFVGDGGCWEVASWSDRIGFSTVPAPSCGSWPQDFSPSGHLLAGISGWADEGLSGRPGNRLVVSHAVTARTVFRSSPLPGAYQVAWENENRLLVLAREEEGQPVVYRCDLDLGGCDQVWVLGASPARYTAWLVPKA